VFAILRIFPRRSFELSFLGVEDDTRFLFVGVPVGLVVEGSFFRLRFDGDGSK
jgi:hypothetical protein